MTPQTISPTHEQGYYVIWDIRNWRKERVCLIRISSFSCPLAFSFFFLFSLLRVCILNFERTY